jgi:phosphopantothenoylcysteine decarboxylase/phosphopantothenate--cysteine ligase
MHVIVGITGGIAAYKATGIIRRLTEAGHTVKVIPTQNALRFIGATTLEALSHNSVDSDLYTDVESVKHVELGQQAELVIVAPASASFLARYAAGIADDLLGNTLLVTNAPVVIAPAMHTEMWQHAATQTNISTLVHRGVHVLEPASGRLTGSDTGVGRLPEPDEIVDFALSLFSKQDLLGKKFLVTAGGTRDQIDPVRFIGNRSSGKQGIAIALEAKRRGASVTLIAANISSLPAELESVIEVSSSLELERAVAAELSKTDCLVMAAAVSDFRVAEPEDTKIKRSQVGTNLELHLVANPDVLAAAVQRIKAESLGVLTVGFAAETAGSASVLEDLARLKQSSKGCDVIFANDVSNGLVFDSDHNDAIIITNAGRVVKAAGTKGLMAAELLDVVVDLWNK